MLFYLGPMRVENDTIRGLLRSSIIHVIHKELKIDCK